MGDPATSAAIAAWVQAVGSILAILFSTCLAIGVPLWQRRRAVADAREAALAAAYEVVKWLFGARALLEHDLERLSYLRGHGFPTLQLTLAEAAVQAIPAASLGSMKAASELVGLRHNALIVLSLFARQPQLSPEQLREAVASCSDGAAERFEALAKLTRSTVRLDRKALVTMMQGMTAAA